MILTQTLATFFLRSSIPTLWTPSLQVPKVLSKAIVIAIAQKNVERRI